jgi:hypothetical protein
MDDWTDAEFAAFLLREAFQGLASEVASAIDRELARLDVTSSDG